MLQITIDAREAVTPLGAAQLRATAAYLLHLANGSEPAQAAMPPVRGAVIAYEDRPDVGAPELPPNVPVVRAVDQLARADLAAAQAAFSPTIAASVPLAEQVARAVDLSTTVAAMPIIPGVLQGGALVTPPTANPAGVQLDSRGLPWDSRIHSTPATMTEKQVWRKKRGLNDEALIKRIEAELLGGQTVPAPVPTLNPAAQIPGGAAVAASVPLPPPAAGPSAATGAAGIPTSGISAPTALASGPSTLPELMQQCAPLLSASRLDMARVLDACKAAGVESLNILQSRPDLVPGVWAQVQARVSP